VIQSAQPTDSVRKPATVLVVEDEVLIRTVLAMELEDAGYEVVEAGTADDAMRLLADLGAIDLMVTDVKMPGTMTGLDLASLVRQRRLSGKIIVMSGYVHEEVAASAAAFDAFVRKPFKPVDVSELVGSLLADG